MIPLRGTPTAKARQQTTSEPATLDVCEAQAFKINVRNILKERTGDFYGPVSNKDIEKYQVQMKGKKRRDEKKSTLVGMNSKMGTIRDQTSEPVLLMLSMSHQYPSSPSIIFVYAQCLLVGGLSSGCQTHFAHAHSKLEVPGILNSTLNQ